MARGRRATSTAQPTLDHASGGQAISSPYVASRNYSCEGLMERTPLVVRFHLYKAPERVEPRYDLGAEGVQVGTALDKPAKHPIRRAVTG